MTTARQRLNEFLFPASSDTWLIVLRVGLAIQVILCTLSLRSDWNYLFRANGNGIISRDLTEAILNVDSPIIPRVGWLVAIGAYFGLSEETVLWTVWIALFFTGWLLLLGLFCRITAVTAWLLHLCAVKSAGLMTYGMDNFTTLGLFYLAIAPLPNHYSLDRWIWKSKNQDPHLLGFFRRVLQVHVCIIYFFSGLAKSTGAGWWNGTSLWRSLRLPPYDVLPSQLVVTFAPVLPAMGIAVCLLEICYPIFIWPNKTRFIWLLVICGMHIAIAVTMGLYLFALIMIVLNLAAFGPWAGRKQRDTTNLAVQKVSLRFVRNPVRSLIGIIS
jgi:Vitamin K-dependent gamma-carboxylase.